MSANVFVVSGGLDSRHREGERARRRAARELIGAYHEERLRGLVEHGRGGFARRDAGEIDVFELDDLIHDYNRSARTLWKFCGSSGSGWETAARTLEFLRQGAAPRGCSAPAGTRRGSRRGAGGRSAPISRRFLRRGAVDRWPGMPASHGDPALVGGRPTRASRSRVRRSATWSGSISCAIDRAAARPGEGYRARRDGDTTPPVPRLRPHPERASTTSPRCQRLSGGARDGQPGSTPVGVCRSHRP